MKKTTLKEIQAEFKHAPYFKTYLTRKTKKMKTSIAKNIRIALSTLAVVATTGLVANAQMASSNPMVQSGLHNTANINNYTAIFNSGKVFVNWTAKNEANDCIYIVERSNDGSNFESVGVKEGVASDMELFYSWMDSTPPAGFAYYRVKKITHDGLQLFSATGTIINQGLVDGKSNYAKGNSEVK